MKTIEQMYAEGINPIDIGLFLKQVKDNDKKTSTQIAFEMYGAVKFEDKQQDVARHLRLLYLPEELKQLLIQKKLSVKEAIRFIKWDLDEDKDLTALNLERAKTRTQEVDWLSERIFPEFVKRYNVSVCKTINVWANVTVEATSEDEAAKIVRDMPDYEIDWDDANEIAEDVDKFEIEDIEDAEDESS